MQKRYLKKIVITLFLAFSMVFGVVGTSLDVQAASPYAIFVNRAANCVTIMSLDSTGQYTIPVRSFVCSVGANIEDTPTGVYTTTDYYEWRELYGNSYGRYAIRFNGHILFHSTPYSAPSNNAMNPNSFNKLGEGASAGCVRMAVGDLKWIYDNCKAGTFVVVYDDASNPGPLGKPQTVELDVTNEWCTYDPTEDDPSNPWTYINPSQYLKIDAGDGVIHGYVGLNAEALKSWIGLNDSNGANIDTWNYSLEINGNYDFNTAGTYTVWVRGTSGGLTSFWKQYTIVIE